MNPTPTLAKLLFASTLAFAIATPIAAAQATDTSGKQPDHCQTQAGPATTQTFYLTAVSQNQDVINIMEAVRFMLCPSDKVFEVTGQSAILVQAPPDQLALAQKLITELDRPSKTYRLTYTVTELDAGKNIGTQHFSMVVVTGQHTSMKEGDKVPVATGSYSNGEGTNPASAGVQTQFTYLDVGMNFDATIDESANGVRLQSKVEQSSVGPSNTIAGVQEPVVRQSVLQGASFLSLGKPVMLGSIDVPNSTRHLDIAVVLDQLK